MIHRGVRIFQLLTLIAVRKPSLESGIVETLCKQWCPEVADAPRLINAAMILSADHELNASSFSARVAASANANPYSAISAALSTFQGTKHGGATHRVSAFLKEIQASGDVRGTIAERLRRGEAVPGFGHRLYPTGDPRGRKLLEMVADSFSDSETVKTATKIQSEMAQAVDELPNIDFALVVLTNALSLNAEKAQVIFALGRLIGWMGHILEQYQINRLIRPRARYIGKLPD